MEYNKLFQNINLFKTNTDYSSESSIACSDSQI